MRALSELRSLALVLAEGLVRLRSTVPRQRTRRRRAALQGCTDSLLISWTRGADIWDLRTCPHLVRSISRLFFRPIGRREGLWTSLSVGPTVQRYIAGLMSPSTLPSGPGGGGCIYAAYVGRFGPQHPTVAVPPARPTRGGCELGDGPRPLFTLTS